MHDITRSTWTNPMQRHRKTAILTSPDTAQTARTMLRACATAAFVLLAAGCQLQTGTTTITNVSIDGRASNATRTVIVDGDGIFDCVRSASGHCYYLLYVDRCASAPPRDDAMPSATPSSRLHGTGCATRVVQRFKLDSGSSRRLSGLPPRVRQCVRHDAAPDPNECARHAG